LEGEISISIKACMSAFIENSCGWTSNIESGDNPGGYGELREIPDGNIKSHYLGEDYF
jgi:hypothetical protein